VAIFVSRQDHCLLDLLWRTQAGELAMKVPLVISNHPDLQPVAEGFGARFVHLPINAATKAEVEDRQLDLLTEARIELVVLAKYMQVLSPSFLERFDGPGGFQRVINIHHSFLPAFIGAAPYRRAKERGVKLVGATAHYVTDDLDEGPIIEQDVVRVDHRHSVEDLVRLGADVERAVLSRAVQWHCEDRVIRYGNQTVVF
jgi:formyltetrahydrofolate deformylase